MSTFPDIFCHPRNIDWSNEGKSYIEGLGGLFPACEDSDSDDIEIFVNTQGYTNDHLPQRDILSNFCDRTYAEPVYSLRRNAWLDDRSYNDGTPLARLQQGPLTADDLQLNLSRPRFRHRRYVSEIASAPMGRKPRGKGSKKLLRHGSSKRKPTASDCNVESGLNSVVEEPDAEKRLLLVVDVDPATVRTLVKTVSGHQAPALLEAVTKHLLAEASIGVTFSSRGFATFRLCFHLPFFAMRFPERMTGDRRQLYGRPLRHTEDISYLSQHFEQTQARYELLHQAHITCVIAGLHSRCWVAHCFVDTYFDDDSAGNVLEQQHQFDSGNDYKRDPLMFGHDAEIGKSSWDPREYFLNVFHGRLGQVDGEYRQIVESIERCLGHYERAERHLSLPRKFPKLSIGSQDYGKTASQDLDLTLQLSSLAAKLRVRILEILRAWEAVSQDFAKLFEDMRLPAQGHVSLHDIEASFRELKVLEGRLGLMESRGARLSNIHERRLDRAASRDSRGFSWIMVLYVSPVALTTSVFSMQEAKIIPFIRPTLGWFIGLIVLFSLLSFTVHFGQAFVLQYWSAVTASYHNFLMPRIDRSRFHKRTRNPYDLENAVGPSPSTTDQNSSQPATNPARTTALGFP